MSKRVAYRDKYHLIYPIAQFPDAVQVILRKMFPDADDVVMRHSSPGDHCHCLGDGCRWYPLCFYYDDNLSLDYWIKLFKDWPDVQWPSHFHAFTFD